MPRTAFAVGIGAVLSLAALLTQEPRAESTAPTSFTDIILAIEGDRDYGAYLAGECVTCHQADGHAGGIPPIAGLPRAAFIRALLEYRTNIRLNEVMKLRALALGDEEIAALAAYFASLRPEEGAEQ